jgi:hypothetical protein
MPATRVPECVRRFWADDERAFHCSEGEEQQVLPDPVDSRSQCACTGRRAPRWRVMTRKAVKGVLKLGQKAAENQTSF